MSQIQKKFIKGNAVDESKILLLNDGALRARNAADSADVSLLKLDASNRLQFLTLPQVGSLPSVNADVASKEYVDTEVAGAVSDVTALEVRVQAIEDDYGVANGLATLDGSGKIPTSQVPAIAITDVYVVANIAARDALTVEEGDVAKVSDAGAGLPRTYIYDGAAWVEIESGSDVDSVNGYTGAVTLVTSDIAEGGATNLYYTPTRQADIEAYADQAEADAIASANAYTDAEVLLLEAEDLTFVKLDGTRPMTGALVVEPVSGETVTISNGSIAFAGANGIVSGVDQVQFSGGGSLSGSAGAPITVSDGLNLSAQLITDVLDPVSAQDAATKAYVDAADSAADALIQALEAASLEWQPVEKFVLDATDISNGYVDLSFLAVEHSIMASVDRLMIHHTDDYTVSVVGGVTRITFAGSLITVGQEKLSAGDVIRVQACKVAIV